MDFGLTVKLLKDSWFNIKNKTKLASRIRDFQQQLCFKNQETNEEIGFFLPNELWCYFPMMDKHL
jgi:hypothetical protein